MANKFFKINLENGSLLRVGFGEPAQNDQIVKDAVERLGEMVAANELAGGPILKINGPASLPVAIAIAHAVGHLYEVIGVFDPKLGKYVVAVSHGNKYQPGDLVD
ncbi:MAG: CRISPR-associated protein Csx3 [Candidatus Pacebacteria bacterium]|nr:CRISPR-associated protein Csx3 [Candidatus Paceibacterota bacterium]NUQ57481.1 CRISPR-associated protein Csx3 [Candidatus Paceibacter sp.]